jgi:hypothetical protein
VGSKTSYFPCSLSLLAKPPTSLAKYDQQVALGILPGPTWSHRRERHLAELLGGLLTAELLRRPVEARRGVEALEAGRGGA